jgi:hypothetical protein
MSNFKDPLDAIIAKHEAAAKGETVEKTDETIVPQVPVSPVPDHIILPTGESIPTPETKAPIEIDYGDDDQDAEIAAEEAERDAMRQAAVEEAAAKRAEEKKTIMPPDSHDPNVMADFANYQTEKVAVVTTMVNKVIAKYHITEGAIPELPDLMNNVKGRREVMGDLIEYFDTHTDNEITPEFEAIILNNWIMPSGEKASVWIKNPHPTYNTPEEEAEAKAKPSVQVNEKLEVVPQITINVPEGSDVTVNVDADVVRNMSESRKVDIVVNKISEKEMKMDVILNTQQKGIIQTYDSGVNDTPVTLPISAYRCVMRPINWFDFIRLVSPSSQNRSDDELKKWSVIYKHLKSPSIGAFKDFDDFLKKTKYQDRELLMWAVLVATADEEEPLSIKCPNPKCRYERTLKYRPRTIVHLDPDHIPAYYNDCHNAMAVEDAQKIFNEVSNKRTRYTLPNTGIIVEISEPSAYDFITKKLNLVQQLFERYVPDGDMSELDPEDPKMVEFDYLSANALYITSMSIIRDGKEYMFDQWEDIEEIIRDGLDTEDSAILLKLIGKSRANTSPVSFYLEDIVCPKCGLKRDKLPINDIGQTLLFQVSRRLDNMEVNLKETD